MNKLQCLVLGLVLVSSAQAAEKGKFGPQATRLHDSHAFIEKSKAADYWALSPYYLSQLNPATCVMASFSMVLNGLRSDEKLTAADSLITETALLKSVTKEEAGKRFYVDHGKSISLAEMGEIFKKVASEFAHKTVKVDLFYGDAPDAMKKIEKVLIENEGSPKNFVVANFLQSEYTGDPEGAVGHAAPVAAYDAKAKRVLILDPDRDYYEPYWVSLETFVKGLNTIDKDAGKSRGILWIHE